MKGKKGGEGPQTGVTPDLSPPPSTKGARVMAAAKRRKRGGRVPMAVPDSGPKVEGKMAPKRLDKPKRARGGSVDKTKYGGSGLEDAGKATMKSLQSTMDKDRKSSGLEGAGKATIKSIGQSLKSMRSDRGTPSSSYDENGMSSALKNMRKRKRGGRVGHGEIGADDKPFTHAKTKTPTKGHSTEANIT